MKKLLIILTTLMTQFVFAGDESYLNSLGFSADGKYYAYAQDGYHDGSGFYWVELGIIDVAKNKYVGRAEIVQQDSYEDEIPELTSADQKRMLDKLKKKLKFNSYGFTNQIKETVLVSRPHTDMSNYTSTIFATDYWAQGGASASVIQYELYLTEVIAPKTANNEWCYDLYGETTMIDLRMKRGIGWESNWEKDYILQVDKKQPSSRACAYSYSISHVLYSNNSDSIAVVIRYREPGFEGPNERFMVVTGKL